jgi:hypothetical protein
VSGGEWRQVEDRWCAVRGAVSGGRFKGFQRGGRW